MGSDACAVSNPRQELLDRVKLPCNMNWLLLLIGVLLIWLAIDIVRLQGARNRLPRPMQDELLFGKGPVSEEQRDFVRQRFYYGASSAQFMAVVLGAFGVWLTLSGAGLL
jgi:hypothetical protein